MENSNEKRNQKRKHKVQLFSEDLKSPVLPIVIQSATILAQKIGNDNKGTTTPQRSIKTLIRGLGSSNTQVQKNYFAILVSLLKSFDSSLGISAVDVLDAITSELHATGHIKKGEEREILIGRVLAFGVLVRSQLLKAATKEEQTTILTQFLQDVKEKSYLPFVGDPFLIDYLKQVDERTFKSTIWPLLSKEVQAGPVQSLLIYHCLLLCEEKFPSVVSSKYLKQTLNSPSVLSPGTAHGLLEALKGEYRLRMLDHPAYSDILKYIVSSEEVLSSFWQEVENQLLVEATSAYNKQIVALKFFSIIVSQLTDASQILNVLTPRLLAWFMKRYKSTGFQVKILHGITKEALNNVVKLCGKTDSTKTSYSVLKKLIFNPGNILFDQLSGTKVVFQLVGKLKEKQMQKLSVVLRDVITGSRLALEHKDGQETTRPWTNREKLYAVHLLCRLLYMSPSQASLEWRLELLTFLFDVGFFPSTNIGVELAGSIRDSFFSSLNHKLSSLSDLQVVLSGVVGHINKRLNSGDQLRIKVPAEMLPTWNKMYKTAKKLGEDKKRKKEKIWLPKVFQTMFFHIGLHLFKEVSFAKDVLQELHSVYERVDDSSLSEDEPHWTEVVMEMFLSLLSRNSQLHRHLLSCVFSHFCPIMTPQNIHQILQVLDPTNNTNPLLNSLESDSESSAGEGSDDDEAVDDKEEEESSDDGMTDGDDDMEEDEEEKVNDKLRRAVIEALGDTGAMTDTESVDLNNMDESEAKRVDQALSAAFQAFKPSKNKKESSQVKALVHFRSRVLDLIEVWMTRAENPPLDLTVDVLLKLLTLLEHSLVDKHQTALEARVRSVIKKLTSTATKKKYDTSDCKSLYLGNILKSILDKGDRSTTVYMSITKELIASTIFIVKASQHLLVEEDEVKTEEGEENISVYTVLKDSMNSSFTQRDCLLPLGLFQGLFSLNIPFLCQLASKLPGYVFDPNVPSYRQTKAVEFLILFWKNNRIVQQPTEDNLERLKKMSRKLYKGSLKMMGEPKGRVQENFLGRLRKAFYIIQEKKWLPDVDVQQHLKSLLEFVRSTIKRKKINGHSTSASGEPMEIENNEDKMKNSKPENAEDEKEVNGDDDDEDSVIEVDENESIDNDDESTVEEDVENNEKDKNKNVTNKEGKVENTEEESEEVSEDGAEEASQKDSEESPSESEEPPKKKSKKKDKKKSREKLRRIQLLKNNSKKLRMESMSAGLDENVFSKYSLLLNKSASPDR